MDNKLLVMGGIFLIAVIAIAGAIVYFGTPEGQYVGQYYRVADGDTTAGGAPIQVVCKGTNHDQDACEATGCRWTDYFCDEPLCVSYDDMRDCNLQINHCKWEDERCIDLLQAGMDPDVPARPIPPIEGDEEGWKRAFCVDFGTELSCNEQFDPHRCVWSVDEESGAGICKYNAEAEIGSEDKEMDKPEELPETNVPDDDTPATDGSGDGTMGSSSAVPVDEEEEELENEVPVEVPDGQCHEFDVLNLRVQGQVVDKDGKTFNDMCINGDTARKYFCDGNIKSFANYECPGSTKCDLDDRNDGICR